MNKDLMKALGLLATEAQCDYIDTLLDQADQTLDYYTTTPMSELSKEEASNIIDEIKIDLGYE